MIDKTEYNERATMNYKMTEEILERVHAASTVVSTDICRTEDVGVLITLESSDTDREVTLAISDSTIAFLCDAADNKGCYTGIIAHIPTAIINLTRWVTEPNSELQTAGMIISSEDKIK